ncbi:hypothetical protein U1Q18_023633 [Sarracenia purpurea var. burkii]
MQWYVVAVLLTVFTSSQGILTTLSQSNGGYKYDYATVPFLAEVFKLIVTGFLLWREIQMLPPPKMTTDWNSVYNRESKDCHNWYNVQVYSTSMGMLLTMVLSTFLFNFRPTLLVISQQFVFLFSFLSQMSRDSEFFYFSLWNVFL